MAEQNNSNTKYDTQNLVVRCFAMVPKNHVLVTTNIFTGKTKVLKTGMHFIAPWHKSVFVSVVTKPISYDQKTYEGINNVDVEMSFSIEVKVSDPAKYFFAIKQGEAEAILANRMDQIMHTLAKETEYCELAGMAIDLSDNSNRISKIKRELKEIEDNYGMKVTKINIKSVNQPKNISDQYAQNEILKSKAKAKADAERLSTDALKYQVQELYELGFKRDEIIRIIRDRMYVSNSNVQTVHVTGDSEDANRMTMNGARFQMGANAVNNTSQSQDNSSQNENQGPVR